MKRLALPLAIFVTFLVAGCDTGTQQRLNCICLIDYSGSLSDQTLRRYVQIISSDVLRHLQEKDRLVVLPIDEGAKTVSVKLVYEDLSDKHFSFHTDGYAHAKDSLSKRLQQYSDVTTPRVTSQLMRQKEARKSYTYYTDIFSALEQVQSLIERNEADTFWQGVKRFITGKKRVESSNMILIFSDMIQESDETSFAKPQGIREEERTGLIEKLRAANRMPNLQGCVVFVDGRTGKTNTQVESIRNFWVEYFKEANADLAAYDYDSGSQITSYLAQRAR